jgi:GAF domain-containing protein
MSDNEHQSSADLAAHLLELAEMSIGVKSLEDFARVFLSKITEIFNLHGIFIYIADSRLITTHFFEYELPSQMTSGIEKLCAEKFTQFSGQPDLQPAAVSVSTNSDGVTKLVLYPLLERQVCNGLIGLISDKDEAPPVSALWDQVLHLAAGTISRLIEHIEMERKITYLNTYLTVSSMLAQSIDLHELMEISLNCSMDIVSAEAASVLLLDDDKKNFGFYQVEGPVKPVLMTTTLPADKGLAASILQANQAEVINDVQSDPRFYKAIDTASGFQTRNMIAIPLIAGDEQIGVLEVLNKVNADSFTEEECNLLLSIAEEIAFAIRNAKVFDYVVGTYCKQRQGLETCKGCSRPLGSWTPCTKQLEMSS